MNTQDLKEFLMISRPYELKNFFNLKENEFLLLHEKLNTNRLFAIIINKLLNNNNLNVYVCQNSILAIPKDLKSDYILVSSHYDNVYENPFFKSEKNGYLGTFDNVIGVITNINLAQSINNQNVAFAFTDCEENTMEGILNTVNCIKKINNIEPKVYIVLDVTDEKVKTSTTIENRYNLEFNLNYPDITFIENKKCGYDEAKYLGIELGKSCLSICCVLDSKKSCCHCKEGSYVNYENLNNYALNTKTLVKKYEEVNNV